MDTDNIKDKASIITEKLESTALPIGFREFSKEEYEKLFPEGIIKTPLGTVKLGAHQFEKMEEKGRKGLIAAMFCTLKDPVVIISEMEGDKEAWLYIKTFRKLGALKITYVISVVVHIDGQAIAISTGKRKVKQVINKIKMARSILYETQKAPSPTIGTGSKPPLPNT
jgi:hypothetical protein